MIGIENGQRASIPEITTRHAADYSHDISLRLLEEIGQTVDSLTEMENALEAVAQAAHTAERMWDDAEPPVAMPKASDELIGLLDETAKLLKESHDGYERKKRAAYLDQRLKGDDEDMIVTSYDRVINRLPGALKAVESLKWTLMDLQALSEPNEGKSYENVEDLLSDLKK